VSTLVDVLFLDAGRLTDLDPFVAELRRAGFDLDWRVLNAGPEPEPVMSALTDRERPPGVILAIGPAADMPAFRDALTMVASLAREIPMIVVSPPDEVAIRTILSQGAADWVAADRIYRLGPAVTGALARYELRRVEKRYRTIFANAADAILVADPDGRYLDANPAAEALLGYSRDEILARRMGDFAVGGREWVDERIAGIRHDGRYSAEHEIRRKDGSIVPVETHSTLIDLPEGQLYIGAWRDISARRKAVAELARERELLQNLMDSLPDLIYFKDTSSRWTRINRAMADLIGVSDPADAVGLTDADFFPPSVAGPSMTNDRDVMASGQPLINRLARIGDRGEHGRWVLTTKAPIRNEHGHITGLVGNSRDISDRVASTAELREAKALYQALVEQLPAVTYVTAIRSNARTTYISPQITSLVGYTPEEWGEQPRMWLDLLHPDDRDRVVAANEHSNTVLGPFSVEYRLIARDGRIVWVWDEALVIFDAEGAPSHWQGVMLDITAQKSAEADLQRSQTLFQAFMDNSPAVAFMKDESGRYVYLSGPMERMYEISLSANRDQTDADFFSPETARQNRINDARVLSSGESIEFVETVATPDGVTREWLSLKFPVTDPTGGRFVGGVAIDISERARLESELRRLAVTDPLTSLPNRSLFVERLERALVRVQRRRDTVAVLFLDLDQFKNVNDSLGHGAGDRLLADAGKRLAARIRPEDTLARFGGDEFAILVDGDATPPNVLAVAEEVIAALREPFVMEGGEAFVGGSIGIAFATARHVDAGELLREADIALYQAKAEGRNRAVVFHPAMNERAVRRLEEESALRRAVERSELELRFQPVVDLVSGLPRGFEALVRWRHPERGVLAPADFLALAEETGLIVPVGEWVLEAACRALHTWPVNAVGEAPFVAVNVSARQVRDAGVGRSLVRILEETCVPPARLTLEVTEHALIEDATATRDFLASLHGLGVRLALDDFGAGYSSFGQLHNLRIDELKIDRSFITNLTTDRHSVAIVRALAELARELDLVVTAEGIETTDQRDRALALGCHRGQGYLFGEPLPPEDVMAFLVGPR